MAKRKTKSSSVSSKAKKKQIEIKDEEVSPDVKVEEKPVMFKDKEKSGDSNTPASSSETKDKFEPKNWRKIVDGIYKMKDSNPSPVDEMPWSKVEDPSESKPSHRFRILVGLMLSPQTNDKTTTKVLKTLYEKGLLEIDAMAKMNPDELSDIIKSVNFRNTKAKNLVTIAQKCRDEFGGDIPSTYKDLTALPGCGPKIAHLVLQGAWDKIEGLAVDTHILRIARRLNLTRKPTKSAEVTQRDIEEWLPREEWFKFNMAMVGFGQAICFAKNPNCSDCLISKLCPVAFKE